ncbi:hypothetical protein C8R44DRAFT_875695 [Mycena epipterygia]|nr:hypothetical protein C8R44DRAFT_875695 [Mycena epipterygia]
MSRLEQEHPIPVAVTRPIVLDFLLTAKAVATATQGPRDFPEYNTDGLPGEVAGAFIRLGIHDEFLNLDFPMTGQLFDYVEHPFMKKVSHKLLEPLFQFYIRIWDNFSWAKSTKTEAEKRVLWQ